MAKSKTRTASNTSTKKKSTKKEEIKETVAEEVKKTESTEEVEDITNKPILIYFSNNKEVKLNSIKKYLSVKEMIREFIHNPNCFIGIAINKDFELIKNFVTNNEIKLDHIVVRDTIRENFLSWIKENTEFVMVRLVK